MLSRIDHDRAGLPPGSRSPARARSPGVPPNVGRFRCRSRSRPRGSWYVGREIVQRAALHLTPPQLTPCTLHVQRVTGHANGNVPRPTGNSDIRAGARAREECGGSWARRESGLNGVDYESEPKSDLDCDCDSDCDPDADSDSDTGRTLHPPQPRPPPRPSGRFLSRGEAADLLLFRGRRPRFFFSPAAEGRVSFSLPRPKAAFLFLSRGRRPRFFFSPAAEGRGSSLLRLRKSNVFRFCVFAKAMSFAFASLMQKQCLSLLHL